MVERFASVPDLMLPIMPLGGQDVKAGETHACILDLRRSPILLLLLGGRGVKVEKHAYGSDLTTLGLMIASVFVSAVAYRIYCVSQNHS